MPRPTAEPLPRDLRERLRVAVQKADNAVGALRAIRREVARLPARYEGQRAAVRWEAEQALRPHWRGLGGDRGAKAAVWAALDGIWEDGPRDGESAPAKAPRTVTVAVAGGAR